MAVAGDERAVEADLARHSGGHDLELGAEEVLLVDAVLPLQVGDEPGAVGAGGAVGAVLALLLPRRGPADGVEVLGGEELVAGLLGLVLAEMRQDVGDHEDGVVPAVAHGDLDAGAVLADDGAVERERQGEPLVLLDAAVDVAVEVDDTALFVDRARLEVEPRRVGVAADHLDAGLGDAPAADDGGHDGAVLAAAPDAVAWLERPERAELAEAGGLEHAHALGVAAAGGLGDAEVPEVFGDVLVERNGLGLLIHHSSSSRRLRKLVACLAALPPGYSSRIWRNLATAPSRSP